MKPTIGRIVLYTLSEQDAEAITKRRLDFRRHRTTDSYTGNPVEAGQTYPAIIVRTWGDTSEALVQLRVLLDGTDDLWATSVGVAAEPTPRHYTWPPRA